jgi:hypothetical protein
VTAVAVGAAGAGIIGPTHGLVTGVPMDGDPVAETGVTWKLIYLPIVAVVNVYVFPVAPLMVIFPVPEASFARYHLYVDTPSGSPLASK